MGRATIAGAAVLAGVCLAGPALADDYPFDGYFATTFDDVGLADSRLTCALSFFRQDKDGSFVNYHLDEPGFEAAGTVRFIPYGSGQCTLVDDERIEACRMITSSDPDDVGNVYVDVIETIGAEVVDTLTFDTEADAGSWLANGEPEPGERIRLVRCPGFDDATVGGALTGGLSTLDLDALGELLYPEMNEANRARINAILDKLRAGN